MSESFEFEDYIDEAEREKEIESEENVETTIEVHSEVNEEPVHDIDQALSEQHDTSSQCASDDEGAACSQHENCEETAKPDKPQHASPEDHIPSDIPVSGQGDAIIEASDPTLPPSSAAHTSFYSLRSRNRSKLVYDTKYHPMDDTIRPSQAAKRRSAHGEKQICFDSDDESDAFTVDDSDAEPSSEHSEVEEETRKNVRGKKRKSTRSRLRSVEPTRRSSRRVAEPKVSYNMNVHPQDEFLVVSSDDEEFVPRKKHKKSKQARCVEDPGSNGENEMPESAQRTHADHADDIADKHEYTREYVISNVDIDSDVITISESPPLPPLEDSLKGSDHRGKGIDSPHLSLGERYSRPDADTWPLLLGQPFKIYHERLEDQLDREASAASPLRYEHDDKENATDNANADMEPPAAAHTRFSIIPASQYTPSSEDRQFSSSSALVMEAFCNDPLPQTYGLDGAHCNDREERDASPKGMSILQSGKGLPAEQAGAESQCSQDSVLGDCKSDEMIEG